MPQDTGVWVGRMWGHSPLSLWDGENWLERVSLAQAPDGSSPAVERPVMLAVAGSALVACPKAASGPAVAPGHGHTKAGFGCGPGDD